MIIDKGHEKLVADVEHLLQEIKDKKYHDFENQEYSAPKMALADKFRILRRDTINGKYDN